MVRTAVPWVLISTACVYHYLSSKCPHWMTGKGMISMTPSNKSRSLQTSRKPPIIYMTTLIWCLLYISDHHSDIWPNNWRLNREKGRCPIERGVCMPTGMSTSSPKYTYVDSTEILHRIQICTEDYYNMATYVSLYYKPTSPWRPVQIVMAKKII
jgi:hypothetical protein